MKKRDSIIVSVALLLAAAAGFYMIWKRSQKDEEPPKGAPQLDVNNPGDQSEFPIAPEEEIELG